MVSHLRLHEEICWTSWGFVRVEGASRLFAQSYRSSASLTAITRVTRYCLQSNHGRTLNLQFGNQ